MIMCNPFSHMTIHNVMLPMYITVNNVGANLAMVCRFSLVCTPRGQRVVTFLLQNYSLSIKDEAESTRLIDHS